MTANRKTRPVEKTSPARQQMAVILRAKPAGYNWGWFSRDKPRMHLQTVDKQHRRVHYKVWLENKGRRVFEPEPGVPAKVLQVLQEAVNEERGRIDCEWISYMMLNRWLDARLVGADVEIHAYAKSSHHFVRTLKLKRLIPNEEIARSVKAKDLVLDPEYAWLEIFPHKREGLKVHVPLEPILWRD